MDKTSLIGIILAFVALSVGMVLKGVSFSALANPGRHFNYYRRDNLSSRYCVPIKRN